VNETTLGIELALAEAGVTYCLEDRVKAHLRSRELQVLPPDFVPVKSAILRRRAGDWPLAICRVLHSMGSECRPDVPRQGHCLLA
jgi:hypothetical protein